MDDQNVQVVPPGFNVIYLPFADDFRNIKFEEDLPRGLWLGWLVTQQMIVFHISVLILLKETYLTWARWIFFPNGYLKLHVAIYMYYHNGY